MSRFAARTWLFLLLLLGCVAVSAPPNAGAAAERQDHLGSRCASCHLAGDEITPENARGLTATQERLCGRCHQGAVEASHPTGFVPERSLPVGFPLDWKGEVTCSTCHDVHRDPARPTNATIAAPEPCAACHPARFFERMADGGRSLMRSGHLDARAHRPAQSIDPYSLRCIECHGDHASLPGERARVAFTMTNGTGMRNHPIGGDYMRADLGRGPQLAAASPMAGLTAGPLPGGGLVPDGKVSCLSCHSGYSGRHGGLVTRQLTDLCLFCHNK